MHSCTLALLHSWVILLSYVVDDKDRLIVVGIDAEPQTLELGGLVEGVACRFEFLLRNHADVEIRDLSTRVTCGCLRATELEGKTLPSNGELSFKATILPTADNYNQKLSLGGITPDGIRKEVAIAHFKGKVASPLSSNPRSVSVTELKSGPVRFKIASQQDGITFDLKKATLLDDRFRLEVLDGDEIAISAQLQSIVEQTLLLQVRFRTRETDFKHTLRIDVVDHLLKVSPASLVLAEQNGHYVGRFIVQSKEAKVLEKVEVSIEKLENSSVAEPLKAEFSNRQAQNTKIFHFKLPALSDGKTPKFRIVVRSVIGNDVTVRTIECLIP